MSRDQGRSGQRRVPRPVRSLVQRGIAAAVPWMIQRSLRQQLAGVWARGAFADLRPGSFLVANHHSWWDGYLAWFIAHKTGIPFAVLMEDANLERFPFFSHHGAIPASRPREFLRRVDDGALGVIFGEGAIRPPREPAPFQPGATRLAGMAGRNVHGVAIRVVSRGMQQPEAYLSFLPELATDHDVHAVITHELAALDEMVREHHPEEPLPSFESWLVGASSPDRASRSFDGWWAS